MNMNRVIYLNFDGFAEAEKLVSQSQCLVISPTTQAARSLQVSHFSLENLAKKILTQHQFALVTRCGERSIFDD
jgi:hypothetical protein